MRPERRDDQTVDAFSLSKELQAAAKARAAKLGMTKSGYFRYCLATELGYSSEDAIKFAQHKAVTNSIAHEAAQSNYDLQDALRASIPIAMREAGIELNDLPAASAPIVKKRGPSAAADPHSSGTRYFQKRHHKKGV